jgi:hypothetical protein
LGGQEEQEGEEDVLEVLCDDEDDGEEECLPSLRDVLVLVRTSGRSYGCKVASLINQRNETAQRKEEEGEEEGGLEAVKVLQY